MYKIYFLIYKLQNEINKVKNKKTKLNKIVSAILHKK